MRDGGPAGPASADAAVNYATAPADPFGLQPRVSSAPRLGWECGAAAGEYLRADDLHAFARALFHGRLVSERTLDTMLGARGVAEWRGYGIERHTRQGCRVYGHGGVGGMGISAEMRTVPDGPGGAPLTVVVLSNYDAVAPDRERGAGIRKSPLRAPAPCVPETSEPVDAYAAPLRARYPDALRCTCLAGGQPCAPELLSVRTMNFGQHWRTEGMTEVAYRAELPLAYVEDVLRERVADYVQDSRDHPDPDDDYDRALAAAGYPDAERVLATPALRDPLLEFFRYEILGHWFGTGHPEREPGYVLNTVDHTEVRDGLVVFAGTARRSGMPVRYQDV